MTDKANVPDKGYTPEKHGLIVPADATYHYVGFGFLPPGEKFWIGDHFGHQKVQKRMCLKPATRKTEMKPICSPTPELSEAELCLQGRSKLES